MGRKGFKNFVKAKPPGEEDAEPEAEPEQPQEVAAPAKAAKPAAAKPAAAKPAEAKAAPAPTGSEDGGGSDEGAEGGPETRGHMLQRHKREVLAHKKAMQRSAKKKEDIAKMTAQLEKKHADELRQLDSGAAGSGGGAAAAAAATGSAPAAGAAGAGKAATAAAAPAVNAPSAASAGEPLSKFLKGLTVDSQEAAAQSRRPTKAQKRREKHAAMDAEREARIAAEKEELGTPERLAEEAALRALLAPLGLGIREIRADGHCMYRSVEDQLRATARAAAGAAAASGSDSDEDGASGVPSYQALRELAASHLRSHRAAFSPYLVPEDEGEDPAAYYNRYCDDVEATATWGGHVELHALSEALGRRITVYGVGMDPQVLGADAAGDGLTLCFLRHALGLGAHYNSTEKLVFPPGGAAGGEEGEGPAEDAAAA